MLLLRTSRGVDPGIPLLRSLGSNAHVWLPGANGVNVASLPSNNYLLSDGSTGYSTVDGVDGLVKDAMDPVTGINLTQATTANKPLVRRGMYNLLTYARDLSNVLWQKYGAGVGVAPVLGALQLAPDGSLTAQRVTFTCSGALVGDQSMLATSNIATVVGLAYTQAVYVKGTAPQILSMRSVAGATYGNLVLDGSWQLLTRSETAGSTASSCEIGLRGTTGSTTGTVVVDIWTTGLFQGTWTAAQILAEGGIPTTTSTAASNPTSGKYWWSFDGSNDSLALGSVPFQMADDFAIIVGFMSNSANGALMSIGSNVSDMPLISLDVSGGSHRVFLRDDAAVAVNLTSAYTTGIVAVQSVRKVANTKVLRANGTQLATSSTAQGATTLTTSKVGVQTRIADANYLSGSISIVIAVKGTLTDAELLLLERFAASVTPGAPVF